MSDLVERVRTVLPSVRRDLENLVRIESVWADPARRPEVQRSADAVAELLSKAGFRDVQIVSEGGAPAVIARHPAVAEVAVIGELDRHAVVRTVVHAGEIPFHDHARAQLQAADARQGGRIEFVYHAQGAGVHASFLVALCEYPLGHPLVHALFTFRRDGFQQLVDQSIAADPFRFRIEVGQDAVTKDRMGDGADVLGRHKISAAQ